MDMLQKLDGVRNFPHSQTLEYEEILKQIDEQVEEDLKGFAADDRIRYAEPTKIDGTDGLKFSLFWANADPFSNFFPVKMRNDGHTWPASEHYFMYRKAVLFNDAKTAEEIKKTNIPAVAKRLGRQVKNFDADVWDKAGNAAMLKACYRKFQQNPILKRVLLSTAGTVLVEASPYDRLWGIGLATADKNCADPRRWRGENRLGRMLTVIREHIIAKEKA